MSLDNTDYEKKLAQANAARQRQQERQQAKLACPKYQQQRQVKQQAAKTRAFERVKERTTDPAYLAAQREKQIQAAERQRQRLRIKESSPEYVQQQKQKRLSQAQALQKKSVVKLKTKPTTTNKSKGLKGRTPTAVEKQLANRIADIGCICCLNKGWYTSDMQEQETTKFVSLHHVDGRTKEWAHAKVLPLCAYHHDTPAPADAPQTLTAIHRGNKKEWEVLNGTEETLLKQVYEIIEEARPWLTCSK